MLSARSWLSSPFAFGYTFLIIRIIIWTLLKVLLWEFGSYKAHFIISLFAFSLFLINKSWFSSFSRLLWSRCLVIHKQFRSVLAFKTSWQCKHARMATVWRISDAAYRNALMNDSFLFICGRSLSERGEVISWRIPGGMTSWWNSGSGYQCFMASVTIDYFKFFFFLTPGNEVSTKEGGNKRFAFRKLRFGKCSSKEGKIKTNK